MNDESKNLFVLLLITSILGLAVTAENLSIVKLVVDETQDRLGNNGMPVTMPLGNAGQSPLFNSISAHYLSYRKAPQRNLVKEPFYIMLLRLVGAVKMLLTLEKLKL